ncbi:MAG: hypothetical protein QNI87_07810 [Erythrobacter sp.]|uniref:hypothetical protein n=1 Tax=Erythrobacter sp. TaxID=1042 RepID=UPI0026198D41|nr:hypothetical protein [Erythrobacter sp.]MDJ0978427.1 hypothetical protein [Erythrobacter sp.]
MAYSTTTAAFAAALASGLLLAAAPVSAQDKAGDKVNMVIAYSEDECPDAEEGEIVVCEILVEAERYRIPSNLRTSDNPANVSRSRQVEKFRYSGAFGTLSCSPAGLGGALGCTQQMIDAAYADKEEGSRVQFARLIEQARQERLSTIDVEAAAEQERVEQIEREYLERLEDERSAPLPGEEETVDGEPASDAPPAKDQAEAPDEAPEEPPVVGPTLEADEEGGPDL